jgi:hypothetical protein
MHVNYVVNESIVFIRTIKWSHLTNPLFIRSHGKWNDFVARPGAGKKSEKGKIVARRVILVILAASLALAAGPCRT